MRDQRSGPRVIAHRGCRGSGIEENTLAAFRRAVAVGADMIEFDVRRTADDELVVFHDDTVGSERVDSLSLPELRERSATEVPPLADVLDWAGGRIGLNVELKEDGYVARVAELLADFQDGGGELLGTSFADPVLAQLTRFRAAQGGGQRSAPLRCGLLIGSDSTGAVGRGRRCGAGTLVIQAELVTDALLNEAVDAGLECLVWDFMVTTPGRAQLLHDERIAAVITDDVPGALRERRR